MKTHVNHVWDGKQKAGSVPRNSTTTITWSGPRLREPEQAMMRSQRGPLASVAFTSTPSDRSSRLDPALFRVLLLRRLHLPPPLVCSQLSVRAVPLGGVWGAEGLGVWSLSWPECAGEGGARVRTNVFRARRGTWHSTTTWMADGWQWWRMGLPPPRRAPQFGHRHDNGVTIAQGWQCQDEGAAAHGRGQL